MMMIACCIAVRGLGFRIDPRAALPIAAALAALYAASLVGRARGNLRLAIGATAFLQMTVFTLIGIVLSYALAARGGAVWDGRLAALDRALGFDWPAIFAAADRATLLLWVGGIAYHSLTLQMVGCILILSAAARVERLHLAVTAAILAGFATILISGVVPALGNVFDPRGYRQLWPSVAWLEQAMLAGLRDGSFRTIDLTQLMGIVTFPSYHATLPVILAWSLRDMPRCRAMIAAWAGITILATPVFGGHYAVDVIAGLALALLAIGLAPMIVALPGAVRAAMSAGGFALRPAPAPGRARALRRSNVGTDDALV